MHRRYQVGDARCDSGRHLDRRCGLAIERGSRTTARRVHQLLACAWMVKPWP
jgi:hypothetical protein